MYTTDAPMPNRLPPRATIEVAHQWGNQRLKIGRLQYICISCTERNHSYVFPLTARWTNTSQKRRDHSWRFPLILCRGSKIRQRLVDEGSRVMAAQWNVTFLGTRQLTMCVGAKLGQTPPIMSEHHRRRSSRIRGRTEESPKGDGAGSGEKRSAFCPGATHAYWKKESIYQEIKRNVQFI